MDHARVGIGSQRGAPRTLDGCLDGGTSKHGIYARGPPPGGDLPKRRSHERGRFSKEPEGARRRTGGIDPARDLDCASVGQSKRLGIDGWIYEIHRFETLPATGSVCIYRLYTLAFAQTAVRGGDGAVKSRRGRRLEHQVKRVSYSSGTLLRM